MKKLIFILFMASASTAVYGQAADEYFHGGAQSFIKADLQTAINEVQSGLAKYPNDAKLNALMQKLKEEQKKQQQQQQQNQQQKKEQQNKENQDQKQQDQQQKDQEQKEQQKKEQQQSDGKDQEEQDPQEVDPDKLQSKQISKEDAEKILKALAQKEKELLKEFKKKKTNGSAKHEKDW